MELKPSVKGASSFEEEGETELLLIGKRAGPFRNECDQAVIAEEREEKNGEAGS